MKPQRVFNANVGQYSVDNQGPGVLGQDIDNINKMFNPDATHTNGESGGIKAENLNLELSGLTGDADSTLHYHSSDRNRENHFGTQPASTISDFATTVRSTALIGLSTATSAVITAIDTVLGALGKLQAQISSNDYLTVHKAGTETITGTKQFTAAPIVPSPTEPYHAVPRIYADALDATAIHKNGGETIFGTKTFSVSPIVPAPVSSNHAVNKGYVDEHSGGDPITLVEIDALFA